MNQNKESLKDFLLQLKGKTCKWALFSNSIQYSVTTELKSVSNSVSGNGVIIKLKGSGTPYISLVEPVKKTISRTDQGTIYEFITGGGEWLKVGVID